ncbi:GNAT family N-acetyltransferase [Paenibacillus dakarensis]|uniref:GNAT family N-acetyltransferase n=1 Tax=Paenibacillus dakarensis TaxID=1527293 RepID=UPI0006D56A5A|nr:GNAT family N-acetyltransferase [Paenibacillus dakarensis]
MSQFQFIKMNQQYAELISSWKYEEPYSIYSMDESSEDILELLNGDYYYVLNEENELIAFICTGNSARVPGGYKAGIYNEDDYIDLGLGLRPELTGKGNGGAFLTSCLQFIKEQHHSLGVRLVVAQFNERAIRVYERAGFVKGLVFKSMIAGQEVDFLAMKYEMQDRVS